MNETLEYFSNESVENTPQEKIPEQVFEQILSKVYVMTDDQSRIIRCEGGYTTPSNLSNWIEIDEGTGDKFNLCQSHYFEEGLYSSDGLPKYKLVDGVPSLRTDEELNKDRLPAIITKKESELSLACNSAINKGSSVILSTGEEEFTYDLADQANVSEMFNAILLGATEYPYHSNNNPCKMYSAADIVAIYSTLSSMKTAQITYHNQLKRYLKSLTDVTAIQAVRYGQELEGEYLESYNNLMAQAQVQLEAILAKVSQ